MGYTQHTIPFEPNTVKSGIFNVLWGLKKNGLSEYTIDFIRKALMRLKNICDLDEPDSVKSCIAEMDVADSYKRNLCYAYGHWLKLNGLELEKPKYYARDKLPRIPKGQTPREEEILQPRK